MEDKAEFKLSRGSSALTAVGLSFLTCCILFLPLYADEQRFLGTHIRRGGGLLKLIEQTIGWHAFVALMLLFGGWSAVYTVVTFWKVLDPTPDVTALPKELQFHPVVRRTPASYGEVSHWTIEIVSGHPVLWIHFLEPYWSLQGLFKRRTIKLEGGREEISPLVSFFTRHPIMARKFISS